MPNTTADRPRPWSREDLQQRLERLPLGHPSSPYNADGSRKPPPPSLRALELPAPADAADARHDDAKAPVEPLTDAEHAEHVTQVRELLDKARDNGLATDNQYLIDAKHQVWSLERAKIHKEVVNDLYEVAADVPCERQAIIAGGPPGAGKTTVLEEHLGVERTQYLMINPDDVKVSLRSRELSLQPRAWRPLRAA